MKKLLDAKLWYRGPLSGYIKTLFKNKEIAELYFDMMTQVIEEAKKLHENRLELVTDDELRKIVNHVNQLNENNDLGMYLFLEYTYGTLRDIRYDFYNCEMKGDGQVTYIITE